MKFALIVISLIGSASAWSSLSMKVGKLVVAARVEMRQGSGLQKIRDGSLGDGWLFWVRTAPTAGRICHKKLSEMIFGSLIFVT